MAGNKKLYKNSFRLQDATDARRFMQRVINAFDDSRIEEDRARAFGYLIKVFLSTVEASEWEERLEELEKHVENLQR